MQDTRCRPSKIDGVHSHSRPHVLVGHGWTRGRNPPGSTVPLAGDVQWEPEAVGCKQVSSSFRLGGIEKASGTVVLGESVEFPK